MQCCVMLNKLCCCWFSEKNMNHRDSPSFEVELDMEREVGLDSEQELEHCVAASSQILIIYREYKKLDIEHKVTINLQ